MYFEFLLNGDCGSVDVSHSQYTLSNHCIVSIICMTFLACSNMCILGLFSLY